MHGFTYNADGEGIEHRGYTAGEGDVESRRWQQDLFAIPREMPVSIARGGRVYLYNELDENGRRTGKQAWFDSFGNEIPDSVVRQKGKLAKGTYPSRSASEDDDFEARRFGDAESRGLPPATVKGTFGTYHRMDLGDQYFMRRGPYERVWKYVCFDSNDKPVDYCFVNEKGRVFYSLAG